MLENTRVDAFMLTPKNPLRYWRQRKAARSLIDGFQPIPHAVRADRDAPLVRALIDAARAARNVFVIKCPNCRVRCSSRSIPRR
jgi:hypothetical protein